MSISILIKICKVAKKCLRDTRLSYLEQVLHNDDSCFIESYLVPMFNPIRMTMRSAPLLLAIGLMSIGSAAYATDFDGDSILNINDADDDNDGILDIDENPYTPLEGLSPLMGVLTDGQGQNSIHANIVTDYVTQQGGPQPPNGADYINGFDARGGVGFSAFDFNSPIIIDSNGLVSFDAYYYDYISGGAGAYGVDPAVILKTTGGNYSVTYTLSAAEEAQLALGEWIPVTFTFTVPVGSLTVTGFNVNLESNTSGFGTPFNPATSEVYALSFIEVELEDTDGDGTPNHRDLDSDNDGIPDIIEAGGVDVDGNGEVDGFADTNSDGLNDATAATPLSGNDTDLDGRADFLDLDADNDGLPDVIEAGGTDADGNGVFDGFVDVNGDGLDDAVVAVPLPNEDSDGDGFADAIDLDSDNDGLPDVTEAGGADADGNGLIDGFADANNDGFDDATAAVPLPNGDFDGDSVIDVIDLDSDNDGLTDASEAGGIDANSDGEIDNFTDANDDGFDDNTAATPLPQPDTDSDGAVDHLDLDSDNDGLTDVFEAGGVDANRDGEIDAFADTNSDGFNDSTATTRYQRSRWCRRQQ